MEEDDEGGGGGVGGGEGRARASASTETFKNVTRINIFERTKSLLGAY